MCYYDSATREMTYGPIPITLSPNETVNDLLARVIAIESETTGRHDPYVYAAGSFTIDGSVKDISYNCSAIHEVKGNEHGHYKITFNTAMSNTNYSIAITPNVDYQNNSNQPFHLVADVYEKEPGYFWFRLSGTAHAWWDDFSVTIINYNAVTVTDYNAISAVTASNYDDTVLDLIDRVSAIENNATIRSGAPYVFAAGSFLNDGTIVGGRKYNCYAYTQSKIKVGNPTFPNESYEGGHYKIAFDIPMVNTNYSIAITSHIDNSAWHIFADVYDKRSDYFWFRLSGTASSTQESFTVTVFDYNAR